MSLFASLTCLGSRDPNRITFQMHAILIGTQGGSNQHRIHRFIMISIQMDSIDCNRCDV